MRTSPRLTWAWEERHEEAGRAGARASVVGLAVAWTAHKQFAAIRRETLCWNFEASNFNTSAGGAAPREIAWSDGLEGVPDGSSCQPGCREGGGARSRSPQRLFRACDFRAR